MTAKPTASRKAEDAPPQFSQINIVSQNPEASCRFYRRLGVEIGENAIWRTPSGIHHIGVRADPDSSGADLDIDSTVFAQVWNTGWHGRSDLAGKVVIGFELASRDRVDALFQEMTAAGYRGLQKPYDAFWGARYAMIEDPDGIAVGLMSPVSPERRSPPPAIAQDRADAI